MRLEPLLPNLEDLQLGSNKISSITDIEANQFLKLKCINLEDNDIEQWEQVAKLGRLQR